MKCCFASSREKTITFEGTPSRPANSRRTSTWPSDPVPPVIKILLPSNTFMFDNPPLVVTGGVFRKLSGQLAPWRTHISGGAHKLFSHHTPVAPELIVRQDLNIQVVCFPKHTEKIELCNHGAGYLIQAVKVGVSLDEIPDNLGKPVGCDAGIKSLFIALNFPVILAQKPLQQRGEMRQLSADDRSP